MNIEEAQRAIDAILFALERDTGETVESIELQRWEITQLCDEKERHAVGVRITMFRIPAQQWAVR